MDEERAGSFRKLPQGNKEIATFDYPGIFDTLYSPEKHHHFVLHELQYRIGPAPAFLGRNKKKSERLSKYERHVPEQWKAPILRDVPLLKGFFAEEPKWREKMLNWCEADIAAVDKDFRGPLSNGPCRTLVDVPKTQRLTQESLSRR